MKRRKFIEKGLIGGTFGSFLLANPVMSKAGSNAITSSQNGSVISNLKQKISNPVIIESMELLKVKKNYFVITKSTDGVTGITKTNSRLTNMLVLFKNQVASFFIGKDARELESLIDEIYTYRRNYKYTGMPLWNCVAHAEISILDMLGRTANLPVNQLIGKVRRTETKVYMSSTERGTTAEEEIEWVGQAVSDSGAKAAKMKIGGRMSKNKDAYPGRSEDLIRLSRKTWGDDFVLYFDSNGSYDVPKAIEMGRLLEEYNVAFYEEPIPWEDFAGTKKVADALNMVVAGGEQDSSLSKWEWMIKNRAIDLAQPDVMYNGGVIRTLQVARIAEAAGMDVTLHSPKNDALAAYMLHVVSIIKNAGPFQEFRAKPSKGASYYTPNFKVKDGKIGVPKGAGFGVDYDPDYLSKGEVI